MKKPTMNLNTKEKPSLLTVILFVLLIVYVVGLFVPVLWAIYASMRDANLYGTLSSTNYITWYNSDEINNLFNNYIYAFQYIQTVKGGYVFKYFDLFANSFFYSFGCAFFFTLSPLLAAYAAARFKFKFSGIVYTFVLVAMSLPIVGAMPSEIKILNALGLFNTGTVLDFVGNYLLKFNFISIYFFILYAQFETIPIDYSESAKIDGASNFKIMWKIIVPQAIGTIVTVFLLSFISFWNDYSAPRVYLTYYPTIAETIQIISTSGQIAGGQMQFTPQKIAAAVITTLPIVIVFIILNRKLQVKVAMGGIKG